jgi:hypothetical protein
MLARELAEIAALLAVQSPVVIQGGGVPLTTSEQYWTASKCRLDRWVRVVRQLAAAAEQPPLPSALSWPRVRPVLEEILASELLTRIWTATAAAYDHARGEQDLAPVARNILAGHLDVRRRLLALLADGRAIELTQAVHLNHLRRRVERWNDMLLAHVSPMVDVQEFAFEPERARDFAEDLDRDAARQDTRFTCQLMLTSLKASFGQGLADRTPNSDLNQRIGSAILGLLSEGACDSMDLVKSHWLDRMTATANETQGMIDELMRM